MKTKHIILLTLLALTLAGCKIARATWGTITDAGDKILSVSESAATNIQAIVKDK